MPSSTFTTPLLQVLNGWSVGMNGIFLRGFHNTPTHWGRALNLINFFDKEETAKVFVLTEQ